MPFGYPPVSKRRPAIFKREKQLKQDGSFNGGVWIVRDLKTNEKFVEKVINPEDVADGKAYSEIMIMRSLCHRNIVHYIDAFIDAPAHPPSASIYMDCCEFGSLGSALDYHLGHGCLIPEELIWSIFMQLINAIGHIHYGIQETALKVSHREALDPTWRGIVHRDIHPGNIFLTPRTTPNSSMPRVLLGDFGLSAPISCNKMQTTDFVYPDANWAPVDAPAFGFPTDIWQLGVLMQTICRLDQSPQKYGPEITQGRRYRGAGNHYTPELSKALHAMMKENWRIRPTIMDVSPIVQSFEAAADYPREDFPACAFHLAFW